MVIHGSACFTSGESLCLRLLQICGSALIRATQALKDPCCLLQCAFLFFQLDVPDCSKRSSRMQTTKYCPKVRITRPRHHVQKGFSFQVATRVGRHLRLCLCLKPPWLSFLPSHVHIKGQEVSHRLSACLICLILSPSDRYQRTGPWSRPPSTGPGRDPTRRVVRRLQTSSPLPDVPPAQLPQQQPAQVPNSSSNPQACYLLSLKNPDLSWLAMMHLQKGKDSSMSPSAYAPSAPQADDGCLEGHLPRMSCFKGADSASFRSTNLTTKHAQVVRQGCDAVADAARHVSACQQVMA